MKGVSGNPALDAYQRMVAPVSPSKGADNTGPVADTPKSTQAAQVSISAQARNLAEASGAERGAVPSNVDKVEALKAQVAAGSFKVDPGVVAQRLVETLG